MSRSGQRPYVESTEQLVVEVFVGNLERSIEFYTSLGFDLVDQRGTFAVLAWERHYYFLDQLANLTPVTGPPRANVRVMVADVDSVWTDCQSKQFPIIAPIADRSYGLRDFTIADPDGFGVRFGSWLR